MWIVSPEDLILSKLFWAKDSFSEMQLGDVKNLLRMVKDLDTSYIEKWVESLGVREVYHQVKHGSDFNSVQQQKILNHWNDRKQSEMTNG